jgi:hypothetical protein
MAMWQGSCQVNCARQKSSGATAKGCAVMQISSVVFGFQWQKGCGRLFFTFLYRVKVHENPLHNVFKEAKFLSKGWY